jgi:hypothetical protein
LFAADVERDATGDQNDQIVTAGEQFRHVRRGRPHLLDVVEHEEELPLVKKSGDGIERRLRSRLAQPERTRDRGQHELRVHDRSEGNEDDAVRKRRGHVFGDAQSQARLADATRSSERQQANAIIQEQGADGRDLAIPADQRGQWSGQVPRGRERDGVRRVSLDRNRTQPGWGRCGGARFRHDFLR